jgi:hypothetical protein
MGSVQPHIPAEPLEELLLELEDDELLELEGGELEPPPLLLQAVSAATISSRASNPAGCRGEYCMADVLSSLHSS